MTATAQKPATRTLTAAEKALAAQFDSLAPKLPGSRAVREARASAMAQIAAEGLPTRKVEAFHYTDLRRLLASVPAPEAAGAAPVLTPLVAGTAIVGASALPDGVAVSPMVEGLKAEVGGAVPRFCGADDAVGAINAAFADRGWRILIGDGASPDAPVEVHNVHGGGQMHTLDHVTVGRGASAVIIDRHAGTDQPSLVSHVTDLTVKAGGQVTFIVTGEQGEASTHLAKLRLRLEENAAATVFFAHFGGKLVRHEIETAVAGEGASLTFRAINLVGEDGHCDVTLTLDHLVANTTSTETVRNVVTGRGQGVFQGQIRVAQVAQKTDARMACNTLLLSDEGSFSTKPELEIFADDVVCAHGATVAEIEQDHLFYLMARGIPEKAARGLLVKAFVAEIVEELENEALVDALEERIDAWLETHG